MQSSETLYSSLTGNSVSHRVANRHLNYQSIYSQYIKTGLKNCNNPLLLNCWQFVYLCHSGHRNTQWHTCSFVGPSSQHKWCGSCSPSNCIFLHTHTHKVHGTLYSRHDTCKGRLTNVAVFTLSTVVGNVQEEQEDQEHPLAGKLTTATTKWLHLSPFHLFARLHQGYSESHQNPPRKPCTYL